MSKPIKKYRPSNGSEGDWFMGKFCYQCIHDNPDCEALSPRCDIMTLTMCLDVTDKDYPNEWTFDEMGNPTCTSFIKWDWGNDGDPTDLDNPKAPIPDNPKQLVLPFIIEEIENNTLQVDSYQLIETNQ